MIKLNNSSRVLGTNWYLKQNYINDLKKVFQSKFSWSKPRLNFIAHFITALISTSSINLVRISLRMTGSCKQKNTKPESKYRSIQRFISSFKMDYEEYIRYVISSIPAKETYYLVMDRTNWKYGRSDINILMVGIIYRDNCIPLYWKLLDKRGSSNTEERKEVLEKVVKTIGKHKIKALLADREFIGVRWFGYLLSQDIEFHIRLPHQVKYGRVLDKDRKRIDHIFRHWKEGSVIDHPNKFKILGYDLMLSISKTKKDSWIIVSSKDNYDSINKYPKRWTIESMFKAMKTSGFNIEDTHVKDLEKIRLLLVLISIAYLWSLLVGIYNRNAIKIRIKNHGRRSISVFKSGYHYLIYIINSIINYTLFNDYQYKELISILSCT